MKTITEEDIKTVESELAVARKNFEEKNFKTLDEKLKWVSEFFNEYVPNLEKRFMTEEELNEWVFLPNELRIKFYQYFPEHGLNMANYSQELVKEKQKPKKLLYSNIIALRHQD